MDRSNLRQPLVDAIGWAYTLHPDNTQRIAIVIGTHAVARWLTESKAHKEKVLVSSPYVINIPAEAKLQFEVFSVSEIWEKKQEEEQQPLENLRRDTQRIAQQDGELVGLPVNNSASNFAGAARPSNDEEEPVYKPTQQDLLVRYIKRLLLSAMGKRSIYAATALGCFLWRYRRQEVLPLGTEWSLKNSERPALALLTDLRKRFEFQPDMFDSAMNLRTRPPHPEEHWLVQQSLSVLAPRLVPHSTPDKPLLNDFASPISHEAEWKRFHRLVHLPCAGLPALIKEWNQTRPEECLAQPETQLHVPNFVSAPQDWVSRDRFVPALSPGLLDGLVEGLLVLLQRQKHFRPQGPLRVDIDGHRFGTLIGFCALRIPSSATCVDIWGEDEQGEFLLAAFALASVEDEPVQSFVVTLEGQQEIALYLAALPGGGASRLGLTYNAEPFHVPLADLDGLAVRLGVLLEHPTLIASSEAKSLLQNWYHLLRCSHCRTRVPEAFFVEHAWIKALFFAEEDTTALWILPFYLLQKGQLSEDIAVFAVPPSEEEYAFYKAFLSQELVEDLDRLYQYRSGFRFWLEVIRRQWTLPVLTRPQEHLAYYTTLLQGLRQRLAAVWSDGPFWVAWLQRQLNCYVLLPQLGGAGDNAHDDWAVPHSLLSLCLPKHRRQPLGSPFLTAHAQAPLFFHLFYGPHGVDRVDMDTTRKAVTCEADRVLIDVEQLPGEGLYYLVVASEPDPLASLKPSQRQLFVVEVAPDIPGLSHQASPRYRSIVLAQAGDYGEAWQEAAASLRSADHCLYLLFLASDIFAPMRERLYLLARTPGMDAVLKDCLIAAWHTVGGILQALHAAIRSLDL